MLTVIQRREWLSADVVFRELKAKPLSGEEFVVLVSKETFDASPLGAKLTLKHVG